MWYKDGKVFNSQQAIRNEMKDVSLPSFMGDAFIESLGFTPVVDTLPAYDVATEYIIAGDVEILEGIPTKTYSIGIKSPEEITKYQADKLSEVIKYFTEVTTQYIEDKVQEYNLSANLAFKDIDAFPKYAMNPQSVHYTIANKFITYADSVWAAVRLFQASATSIPTEEEFKALLDSVVFE